MNSGRSKRVYPFSEKQLKVLSWWLPSSKVSGANGLIADGAIRSGKSFSMALAFMLWAMDAFHGQAFALCGLTISSFRRNVLRELVPCLEARGYKVIEHRSENRLTVAYMGRENQFFLFGGQNEGSQDLIQGVTLAGIFFDEVALMPESFVNQATGRCSVEGSKFWFNCNPRGPYHWFKTGWIDRRDEKRLLYLHFTMADNPSLSPSVRARYEQMYKGVFYNRYILGRWEIADGVIYDMWDDDENTFFERDFTPRMRKMCKRYVSVDYGTSNPMVFLDAYDDGDALYILREYYYDSKKARRQKTDQEYADDFEAFTGGDRELTAVLDPSAISFKLELRKRGFRVKNADNAVQGGVRLTGSTILKRKLRVEKVATIELQKERASYVWNEKAAARGEEIPVKERDHAMDAMRYLVKTVMTNRRCRDGQ